MQHELTKKNVIIILRLIGVVISFIGLILTTSSIFQTIGARSAASAMNPAIQVSMKGMAGQLGFWVTAGYVSIVIWGLILYAMSEGLADIITSFKEE